VIELCPTGSGSRAIWQTIVRAAVVIEHEDIIAPPETVLSTPTGEIDPVKYMGGIVIVIRPPIINSEIVEKENITGSEFEI
jgi:hypothetical protein